MKYKQDPRLGVNSPVGIAERKTPPVLSISLAIAYVVVYYFYQSVARDFWITHNAFTTDEILNLISTQNYGRLANVLLMTNFANVNLTQLLASMYFTCLFAIPVEKRLGPLRFISLIILACILPWAVQFIDVYRFPLWPIAFQYTKQGVYFFGPYTIMLALAGAYSVLASKKEPDKTNSRLYRKDRTEIFNRVETKSMNDGFGLSPTFFFSFFILYAIGSHFVISYFYKDYDTIGLYAGLTALAIGFILASFVRLGLEQSYQEHPLKHAVIKHYYELLDLDVGHTNAVKGAAKALGLPDEQVEDWVKKSKGKLRPT